MITLDLRSADTYATTRYGLHYASDATVHVKGPRIANPEYRHSVHVYEIRNGRDPITGKPSTETHKVILHAEATVIGGPRANAPVATLREGDTLRLTYGDTNLGEYKVTVPVRTYAPVLIRIGD